MTDAAARIAALEAENFALRSEIARTSPGAAAPPKDSLAYQILRAGAIARNEPCPE
jgi:hypothetical protein